MKTPIEKMIVAVEGGEMEDKTLWCELKQTLLGEENELLKKAFLCGDNEEFHFGIKGITSFTAFMEYFRKL